MTHNKMLDRNPSVQITSNRNELKVYQDNIVYLNNGDNFELRFFNPLQEKLGVEVCFNGEKKGDGYLILNPGQDLNLDRFLDEQRKMVFETYSINGDSKEAREAIAKNGKISFNFFKESNWYNNYHKEIDVNYDFPPKPKRYDDWNNNISFSNTSNYNSNSRTYNAGVKGNSGPQGSTGNLGVPGQAGTTRGVNISTTTNVNIPYQATLDTFSNENTTSSVFMTQSLGDITNISSFDSTFKSPGIFTSEVDYSKVETGRVERGDISNQSLKSVNVQFQPNAFYTVEYQIMPHSAKNRGVTEIRQYCSECGYRLRKNSWKFCPKCGEKIQ